MVALGERVVRALHFGVAAAGLDTQHLEVVLPRAGISWKTSRIWLAAARAPPRRAARSGEGGRPRPGGATSSMSDASGKASSGAAASGGFVSGSLGRGRRLFVSRWRAGAVFRAAGGPRGGRGPVLHAAGQKEPEQGALRLVGVEGDELQDLARRRGPVDAGEEVALGQGEGALLGEGRRWPRPAARRPRGPRAPPRGRAAPAPPPGSGARSRRPPPPRRLGNSLFLHEGGRD